MSRACSLGVEREEEEVPQKQTRLGNASGGGEGVNAREGTRD